MSGEARTDLHDHHGIDGNENQPTPPSSVHSSIYLLQYVLTIFFSSGLCLIDFFASLQFATHTASATQGNQYTRASELVQVVKLASFVVIIGSLLALLWARWDVVVLA